MRTSDRCVEAAAAPTASGFAVPGALTPDAHDPASRRAVR